MSELKPCPFCGSSNLRRETYGIECRKCGVWMGDGTQCLTLGNTVADAWNNRADKLKDKILNWLLTGSVGQPSKAMAQHLLGLPCYGSYPHDPEDFNHCLLFLQAVPEARAELHKMATVNNTWAALVARWGEIEAMFLEEVGLNWCKGGWAVRTHELMKEVIDEAQKEGWKG